MTSLLNKLTGKSNDNNDTSKNSASHSSSGSTTSGNTGMHGSTTGSTTMQGGSTTTTTTTQHTNQGNMGMSNTGMTGTNMHTGTGYSGTGTNTDNAMTRSEEQLRVGKETVGAGKAALDKYVTSEHVEKAVPVTKERVVIEREPINSSNVNAATSGVDITEAHHEVTLTEERAVAAKEVVPIERIRLGKQVETHEQTVAADLRKEHVDLTTTGINEKFDNVGYGRTMGTKMDQGNMGTTTGATTTTQTTTNTTCGPAATTTAGGARI